MFNPAERKFAQALVTQINDEFNRAHGKEMHLTPTQLIFAAKHTIEVLLTDITVLETERALRDAPQAPPAAVPEGMVMVQLADIRALEAVDFGRCGWRPSADVAARRIRAAARKGEP